MSHRSLLGIALAVAIKDRAAILMVGRLADAAFWMSNAGEWITSNAYRDRLPGYLDEIDQSDSVGSFGGRTWDRLLPAGKYQHGPQEDRSGTRSGRKVWKSKTSRIAPTPSWANSPTSWTNSSKAAIAPTLARLLRVDPPSRCVEDAITDVMAKP